MSPRAWWRPGPHCNRWIFLRRRHNGKDTTLKASALSTKKRGEHSNTHCHSSQRGCGHTHNINPKEHQQTIHNTHHTTNATNPHNTANNNHIDNAGHAVNTANTTHTPTPTR